MKQIIVCDFDDVNIASREIEILKNIKEHISNFRCSIFTTPMHPWLLEDEKRFENYLDWVDALKELDWLEICPHGFFHDTAEMMVNYETAKATFLSIEKAFTHFKVKRKRKIFGIKWVHYYPKIKFAKIFKAPKWQMSKEAYEAARDLGYVVAIDRNQPTPQIKDLKTYKYNWSIEEPFPTEYKIIKGHGHIRGMPNDISLNYLKLINDLPQNGQFMTIGEFLSYEQQSKKITR